MVDTNRDIFVLQDDSGAMAVSLNGGRISFQPGQVISIQGTEASPYFQSFPCYPYQPSGWDVMHTFEAPSNWGEYHLTRMRGYIHPPISGDYSFWIASDNSSELWLSSNEDPANIRRIAIIKSGDWVNQHEWSHYPSQHSEIIKLNANKKYYIEALSEQLVLDENLAVAWQPPGSNQAVIDGRYLTPWIEDSEQEPLSEHFGVLREYWTNYTLGNVVGIIGQKSFSSIFALKNVEVHVVGKGAWPESQQIQLDQTLPPENNFHWAKVQGKITFIGINGKSAILELTYNGRKAEVRVSNWNENSPEMLENCQVQVEGVCEGMQTVNGHLTPDLIWTPSKDWIQLITPTNASNDSVVIASLDHLAVDFTDTNSIWNGFVSVRGVVTFNDEVLGRDFLFIQDDAAGIYISQASRRFDQLQVGQGVDIGGTLTMGGYTPSLAPVMAIQYGRRPMPEPVTRTIKVPVEANRNGQWTEFEGVVRSFNTNGIMVMMGKAGRISVWIGHTSKDALNAYPDSILRLRGVLSLAKENSPILLVPSRSFVEVKEVAPKNPFEIPTCFTTDIGAADAEARLIHRMKIEGTVIYKTDRFLFVQDVQGGLRVELPDNNILAKVGDKVEVVGFPGNGNMSKTLTEALVRVIGSNIPLIPKKINSAEGDLASYCDTLISLEATILAQKTKGLEQFLDLQEGQHFYEAVLSLNDGRLPVFESGSRLEIVGVLQAGQAALTSRKSTEESGLSESIKIFVRNPKDIVLLRGAPWWTWKGFVLLAGILLMVVIMGLLVIYILRRRLERQQLAKFIFSRQILQSQEEERHRIAVNLHDTLGQNLLIIKNQSHLAMQPPVDESVIRKRLNEISEVTTQAIEEVRQITRNLRPYQLDRLGLTFAVRAVIKQMSENSAIVFASHVDDLEGTFDKESEIHVYRIIQEGINNIIKHSGATEATIIIKKNPNIVSLSIRDNGRGFDVSLDRPVGFGLNNIMERVWILGGESKIDSSSGCGTYLFFEIPVPNL